MRPVIIVGEGQLLQMPEDVVSQLMNDRLAHPVGDFDFDTQGKHGIKDDQKRQQADPEKTLNIPVGDDFVHDGHEETGNQHGGSAGGKHEYRCDDHILFIGDDIAAKTFQLPEVKMLFIYFVHIIFVACH